MFTRDLPYYTSFNNELKLVITNLITVKYTFSGLFTDNILVANAFVFFVAGFETTASTISYCLYELAKNQKIQDDLRKKIKETLDANNGELSYDMLKDMKYLDMIING